MVAGRRLAWVETEHQTREWWVARSGQVPADLCRDVQRRPEVQFSVGQGRLWLAEGYADKARLALRLGLGRMFVQEITSLCSTWRSAERGAYDRIGYRSWNSRIPAHPDPDPLIRSVAKAQTLPTRPLSYDDIVQTVDTCRLLACVPDSVAAVWQRAIKLFLWGYQDWDLFTIAEHYVGLAVDTSLRALRAEHWSYPARIEFMGGRSKSPVVIESFIARDPAEARLWYRPDGTRFQQVNGQRTFLGKHSLLKWAETEQWVSSRERSAIALAFVVRDMMSHPDRSYTQWFGEVEGQLLRVNEAINGMWARHRYPSLVPWEGDFPAPPQWTSS